MLTDMKEKWAHIYQQVDMLTKTVLLYDKTPDLLYAKTKRYSLQCLSPFASANYCWLLHY